MKKCTHCGCVNKDERTVCADCSRTLANSEEFDESGLEDMLDRLSEHTDWFSFKPRHKVVFFAGIILIAVNIILLVISSYTSKDLIYPLAAFISFITCIPAVVVSRFSKVVWEIEKFFLQFKVSGDIEPSDWWFISREITIYFFIGAGAITFLYGLIA